uniref:helix-turn-helix transcriptional regulator n=1 Tax=Puniceibacterium confluentis TaxID=1958944 RepID=UPI003569C606
ERMRRDRVYSQVDLPGPAPPDQPLRALRCAVGPQDYAVVTLQRQAQDFRAADAAQLSRLAPYLGPAMASWQALEQDRARAALDRRLAADLGGFWLLLTASGRVSDMAPALRARLADIPALRLQPGGWLEFSDPATAQSFRQALAAARSGPCPIELSRAPPLQLVISAEPFAGQEMLVGYLRQGPHARALPVERVAGHFGLSRSEARLALLLCDGFSLQEAAQELGWTRETARSCSKQIFARMGVSGQPGVLRRVLGSAVWLS